MTDTTPARAVLRYAGDEPVSIVASANPIPSAVSHGDDVVVDAWAVPSLTAGGRFVASPAASGELRGEALLEALRTAGLPTSGTADEKRARLADAEAARIVEENATPAGDPDVEGTPDTADQEGANDE
jgi:hypothetical protein